MTSSARRPTTGAACVCSPSSIQYTRECLAISVARRMTANDVLWVLADLFLEYGIPEHIRSDNGPEFVAKAVRDWLAELGVTTLFIEPGSP